MRKPVAFATSCVCVLLVLAVSGCKRELVEVQSGTQVVCTYGEVVSEDVQTLKVPAAEAARHSVRTSTVTCERHRKLEALYGAAQRALASGDTKAARKRLAEVVAIDRTYRKAAEQIEAIDGKKKPAPDTAAPDTGGSPGTPSGEGTGKPDGNGDAEVPVGPAVNLVRYVPDSIPGYSAMAIVSDPLSLSRNYRPLSATDIGNLVIAADQYRDGGDAQEKLVSRVQPSYPANAAAVTVAGKPGYFGTDGREFAILAVRDGAVVVVFEMLSRSRRPANLKDELLAVAGVVF